MVSCYVRIEMLYDLGVPIQLMEDPNIRRIDGMWVHRAYVRYLLGTVIIPTENWYVIISERVYNISIRYVLRNWYWENI